jgi:hypothetical protein
MGAAGGKTGVWQLKTLVTRMPDILYCEEYVQEGFPMHLVFIMEIRDMRHVFTGLP